MPDHHSLARTYVVGCQGFSYFSAIVLSVLVCVPMSIHQDDFQGHCLLFTRGRWMEHDGSFSVARWASQAYCNFVIFVAVVVFVVSTLYLIRLVNLVRRNQEGSFWEASMEVRISGWVRV